MDFIIFVIIVLLGLFFGRRAEKKHYASIEKREEEYKNIAVLSDKDLQEVWEIEWDGVLLTGWTVVSIDAFKKLMAGFVNFFGWRMKSYESLVDRARREAVLKVKQQAVQEGYNTISNLRIETSSITKNARKTVGAVEAMAYASGVNIK